MIQVIYKKVKFAGRMSSVLLFKRIASQPNKEEIMVKCSLNYLVTPQGYLNNLKTQIKFQKRNYWRFFFTGKWRLWRHSVSIITSLKKELYEAQKLLKGRKEEDSSQEIIEMEMIDEEKENKPFNI